MKNNSLLQKKSSDRNGKTLMTHFCRPVALILALLLILSLFSVSVPAEESTSTKIKVGYYENEIFQEGAEAGAIKSGYAYEYYRKLSEYTGWEYEYVYGDFADLYQQFLDGKIDLMAGLAKTEEREGLVGYPELEMGHESYVLMKHSKSTDITSDPSTLNGKTIGVLDSAMVDSLNSYLTDNQVVAEVKPYSDYTVLFDDYDNEKLDILAAEDDGIYGREHSEVICVFNVIDYYLCVTIDRPDLLEKLNAAQNQLAIDEPNYLHTLENKYFPVSVSAHTLSDEEKEWIDTHDVLDVGYLENYLPYSDTDKDGSVTGVVKDVVPIIFDNLDLPDLEFRYHAYQNYSYMIEAINDGEIDLAFPIGGGLYFSEINGIYQSNPVITSTDVLVFKGDYDDETTSVLAINENNTLQYYSAVTNFPDAEFVYYSTIEECLDAVNSGEANGTIINGMRVHDILKSSKYDALNRQQMNQTTSFCFGVEIGNEGLLKLINRGINSTNSYTIKNLAYRYSADLYQYTLWDSITDHLGIYSTVFILIIALIIFLLILNAWRKRRQISATEKARLELEEKNKELAESQEALSNALKAAEFANNAKTTFLNNMSHDIRTPMNAIVGFTAMAATHIDEKEKVQDYLSKISVSSRHLLSLINDVLDMSRIESGMMKIEETEVHLPDMIHDLRTIIQSQAKAKQMDLLIDTQDVAHEDIITDKLRLSQVLLNILTNAVKFTPPGGTVSFRVIEKRSDTEGMTNFEFRIKDNGIGMSEDFQKEIFDAFSREQTSTVSGVQGTGLGMAISKNIVDLMNGTIIVASEVGKGSEFVVNIPCKVSPNTAKYEQLDELQGLRALVADDDANTCLSICSMLREIGMRPDWTNYGKEAVIRAKEAHDQGDRFRVYIIDWMMPDMNGIETVRRIRRVIDDNDLIIILTAYDWSDIEEEAREAGVTAFCSKPLFMSELRDVLTHPFLVAKKAPDTEESSTDFSGKRLLIAEDNEMNQLIAVNILEEAGFAVDVAQNGQEAVDLVKAADPGYYDAILMDIQMPVMDGYEAARQIRKLEDNEKANIPIVAVTANAFEEDRKTALETGMNGHLAKPYDIPMMMDTLETILNKPSNE